MSSPDRNDPCPCGSGKKYKKCHGSVTADRGEGSTYDRLRRLESEVSELMITYARQKLGKHILERAWPEYRRGKTELFDLYTPEIDPFVRWFTFNRKTADGIPIAASFLKDKAFLVHPEMRLLIETTLAAPYSFYQVTELVPGESLVLRDILMKRSLKVFERSASTIVAPGHILYARITSMEGVSFFMGCGTNVLSAMMMNRLVDAREHLVKSLEAPNGTLTAGMLHTSGDFLREMYFTMVEEMRRVDILNADGDPLEFHTLTYEISSPELAFQRLKDLEQSVTNATDVELLESGRVPGSNETSLHWMRKGTKSGVGDQILGTITIKDMSLIVQVNSENRSIGIKKEISERMGDAAVLMRTEVSSSQDLMDRMADAEDSVAKYESDHDRIMRESPEARALTEKMMKTHWSTWPDIPLPALRGMTPREAAKDPVGRELLESVLLDFEARNSELSDSHQMPDVGNLRRELGLNVANE